MPINALQLASCIRTTSFVPRRTLGSELTSSTAALMATFATLPMVELNANIAPMFTTAGLEVTFLQVPLENRPKKRAKNGSKTSFMVRDLYEQKTNSNPPTYISKMEKAHTPKRKGQFVQNSKIILRTRNQLDKAKTNLGKGLRNMAPTVYPSTFHKLYVKMRQATYLY